jgi:hypothetical protein
MVEMRSTALEKRPQPAPIFLAGFATAALFIVGYVPVLVLPIADSPLGWLLPLIHSIYSITIIGTGWYTLGRFLVALPSWRPSHPISFTSFLHYSFNFHAVSLPLQLAGLVLGVVTMNGGSLEAWEWPTLLVGLVCGHFAWVWADKRADRILRQMFPRITWPDAIN